MNTDRMKNVYLEYNGFVNGYKIYISNRHAIVFYSSIIIENKNVLHFL